MELFLNCESKTGEMDTPQLVDLLSECRRIKGIAEKREKQVAEVLKSAIQDQLNLLTPEVKEVMIPGVHKQMQAIRIWQKRLDTDMIRLEMGEDWVETHSKLIDFVQFKFPKGKKGAEQ